MVRSSDSIETSAFLLKTAPPTASSAEESLARASDAPASQPTTAQVAKMAAKSRLMPEPLRYAGRRRRRRQPGSGQASPPESSRRYLYIVAWCVGKVQPGLIVPTSSL